MILILDEWIIHDLINDNGEEKQKESFQFLERMKDKCDKICLVKESKFMGKIGRFAKLAANSLELKNKFRFLKLVFLENSEKCEIIKLQNAKNGDVNVQELLVKINPDDHYLVIAYSKFKEEGYKCVIITTDNKLKEALHNRVSVSLRDSFIKEYK